MLWIVVSDAKRVVFVKVMFSCQPAQGQRCMVCRDSCAPWLCSPKSTRLQSPPHCSAGTARRCSSLRGHSASGEGIPHHVPAEGREVDALVHLGNGIGTSGLQSSC